jgi:hypothetical protein
MPAAIRAGSMAKLTETMVKRQEPSETSICVRKPAGLWAISRSMSTTAPNATAKSKLRSVSKVSVVSMTGDTLN